MKVREVMSTPPVTCRTSSSLSDAAAAMWRNDCGALPGVDEHDTAAVMFSRLASNLRDQQAPADARPPEERLRKLQELRDQGLITEEEYAARRTAILEEL